MTTLRSRADISSDPSAAMLPGIDVSAWQPHIDWRRVATSNQRFALIKATEGATYRSPTYAAQIAGARDAGLLVGAYHFARWERDDPDKQAEHFVRQVGEVVPGMLSPVLDLEWCSTGRRDARGKMTYHKRPAAEIAAWAVAWVRRVVALTGRIPIVYTGRSFWSGYLPTSGPEVEELSKLPLWTIDYRERAVEPKVPRDGWQWDFWQWTGKGRVDGVTKDAAGKVPADCDRNWFRGSEAELLLFAGRDERGST